MLSDDLKKEFKMKKIKEVIVVEGKDDTKQIQRAVDADTFETNGSALSSSDIEQLKKLQKTRGPLFLLTLTLTANACAK